MKIMFCWRCKMDVPMLDEEEFQQVGELYESCIRSVKTYRRNHGVSVAEAGVDALVKPVCDLYEKMTGFRETNANAIMHHRISDYGLPCAACNTPLRTPRAKLCAACGSPRGEV